MLFFVSFCEAYAPVILPYSGPFMLTLGAYESYMLFLFFSGSIYARFSLFMLAKSPTLTSAQL